MKATHKPVQPIRTKPAEYQKSRFTEEHSYSSYISVMNFNNKKRLVTIVTKKSMICEPLQTRGLGDGYPFNTPLFTTIINQAYSKFLSFFSPHFLVCTFKKETEKNIAYVSSSLSLQTC